MGKNEGEKCDMKMPIIIVTPAFLAYVLATSNKFAHHIYKNITIEWHDEKKTHTHAPSTGTPHSHDALKWGLITQFLNTPLQSAVAFRFMRKNANGQN